MSISDPQINLNRLGCVKKMIYCPPVYHSYCAIETSVNLKYEFKNLTFNLKTYQNLCCFPESTDRFIKYRVLATLKNFLSIPLSRTPYLKFRADYNACNFCIQTVYSSTVRETAHESKLLFFLVCGQILGTRGSEQTALLKS